MILKRTTCVTLVLFCCAGCIDLSRRQLTLKEEQQLKKKEEYAMSLPRGQKGSALRQVECTREVLAESGSIHLDKASDRESACRPIDSARQHEVMKERLRSVDETIDRNLHDALHRVKE